LARLYQERWEIELGFRDIKSSMQHNAITLHSMTVELDYQELWGSVTDLQYYPARSGICSGGLWTFSFEYPFQACMPVHSRSADCDGECQPIIKNWQAAIGAEIRDK